MSARSRRRRERRVAAAVAYAEKHLGVRRGASYESRPDAGPSEADRDAPLHAGPSPLEAVPPFPSRAVAGEGKGLGDRKGSKNGLTHGLYSREAVLEGESEDDLDTYRAEMEDALQPQNRLERDQVEVIVMSHWRLRRLWRQEAGIYGYWKEHLNEPDPQGTYGFLNDCADGLGLVRLYRVEAHLTRTYLRAQARLRLLQDLRRKGLGAGLEVPSRAERVRSSAPQPIHPASTDPTHGGERVGAGCHAPEDAPNPPPVTMDASEHSAAVPIGASVAGLPEAPAQPRDAPNSDAPSPPPSPMASKESAASERVEPHRAARAVDPQPVSTPKAGSAARNQSLLDCFAEAIGKIENRPLLEALERGVAGYSPAASVGSVDWTPRPPPVRHPVG